jgi:ubiquinone/menaquinone biosynthesis C-methylase UbiE
LLGTVGAQAGKTVSAQQVATYAQRLSFGTGAADAVLSIDALGLEDDVAGAVAEASRVLKPGRPLLFFEKGAAPGPLTEELRKCGEFSSVRCVCLRAHTLSHALAVAC